ncbi:MAG: hypothetical protein ACK4NF_05385, partial [Planctomycetota bacterium]
MSEVKLQVFLDNNLLSEFPVEEDREYSIGSSPNATIPLFDAKFPSTLLLFKKVGDFIKIEKKEKSVTLPPILKIPSSFVYKNYKFVFRKSIARKVGHNLLKVATKKYSKNKIISLIAGSLIVTGIVAYIIFSHLVARRLEREFNNDLAELARYQSKEVLDKGKILLKKYKNTKYEKEIRRKVDELVKIKNEYASLVEKLRLIVNHKTNYHELARYRRQRRKILEKIQWTSYKEEAKTLLNKLELKIIFVKHRAFLNVLKELNEQINDERFVQAYLYYSNVLNKNKLVGARYKNVIKKKLDKALEKDISKFKEKMTQLLKNPSEQNLDQCENLIKIKINTYPAEYTPYFKGLLTHLDTLRKNLEVNKKEEVKTEEEEEEEEEREQKKAQVEKSTTQLEKEEQKITEKPPEKQPIVVNDSYLIKFIKDKKFDQLKTIFTNENYRFQISSETYSLVKIFTDFNEKCKNRGAFDYVINKVKKTIVSCELDNIVLKDKNPGKNIRLMDMPWEDIAYIILAVEDD